MVHPSPSNNPTAHASSTNDPAQWQAGLPQYSGITYRELWPGVDLRLGEHAKSLKYEFRVRAGTPVSKIRMAYRGASRVTLDGAGALLIETIFSLDGLGLLSFESIVNRDYPVVFANLYIFSLLGLFVNLLSDLTYTWIDPRIDFETREV